MTTYAEQCGAFRAAWRAFVLALARAFYLERVADWLAAWLERRRRRHT